jgi:uncharacterized UBP type Zn finger protein
MKLKKKQKKIIIIFLIIIILCLGALLLFLHFRKNIKFSSSNALLDVNNIKEILNDDIIIWKDDMFNPQNTIGYPNLRKAYVVCYLNSALQLIRTFFMNLFQIYPNLTTTNIPIEINYFLNYINEEKRHKAVESMLKLIVPDKDTRLDLFYINKQLHQSDSSEFLIFFLQYLFETNIEFKNSFTFDLVSSLQSTIDPELISYKTIEETTLIINNINQFKNQNITNLSTILQTIIGTPSQDILPYRFKDDQENILLEDPNTIKTDYYSNFSQFLLVQLNIFEYNEKIKRGEKINFYAYIPELITFTTNDSIIYNYTPISIICHQGGRSAKSGHYVNYSKNSLNNKWYLYNDINVYEILDNSLNKSIRKNNYNPFVVLLKRI